MVMNMKVNGVTINLMVMEHTSMGMVLLTLGHGLKICSMVLALKNGQMVHNMKVSIKMVKNMEMVGLILLMQAVIKDFSNVMK